MIWDNYVRRLSDGFNVAVILIHAKLKCSMINALLSFTFQCRSSLVPVFGFGQNDCFRIPASLDYLRSYKTGCARLEKWFKILIRNTLITFFGKYKFIPALPYNKPIAVVGMIWSKYLAKIKLNMLFLRQIILCR